MRVRVEEARSCMQSARSQSKVLDSLLQLKRSGRIPGIHGRLVCRFYVCVYWAVGCLSLVGPLIMYAKKQLGNEILKSLFLCHSL